MCLEPIALFQSAPLTEARGDIYPQVRSPPTIFLRFNPLPSPKQGETIPTHGGCRPLDEAFQSAPLTEARGDNAGHQISARPSYRFNPLPSPKQGETWTVRVLADYKASGFNPLPSPKQGETKGLQNNTLGMGRHLRFNPLPSPKQGETTLWPVLTQAGPTVKFQSAPLTEARGDSSKFEF